MRAECLYTAQLGMLYVVNIICVGGCYDTLNVARINDCVILSNNGPTLKHVENGVRYFFKSWPCYSIRKTAIQSLVSILCLISMFLI